MNVKSMIAPLFLFVLPILWSPSLLVAQVQHVEGSEKTVSWRPDIEFDGQLFPAFVLGMARLATAFALVLPGRQWRGRLDDV